MMFKELEYLREYLHNSVPYDQNIREHIRIKLTRRLHEEDEGTITQLKSETVIMMVLNWTKETI